MLALRSGMVQSASCRALGKDYFQGLSFLVDGLVRVGKPQFDPAWSRLYLLTMSTSLRFGVRLDCGAGV